VSKTSKVYKTCHQSWISCGRIIYPFTSEHMLILTIKLIWWLCYFQDMSD